MRIHPPELNFSKYGLLPVAAAVLAFLVCFTQQTNAQGPSGSSRPQSPGDIQNMTVHVKNLPLKAFMDQLSRDYDVGYQYQSEYSKAIANAPAVSVDSDHEPLDRVIAKAFRRQSYFTYSIFGRTVAIYPK